jgi:hypothetical protein
LIGLETRSWRSTSPRGQGTRRRTMFQSRRSGRCVSWPLCQARLLTPERLRSGVGSTPGEREASTCRGTTSTKVSSSCLLKRRWLLVRRGEDVVLSPRRSGRPRARPKARRRGGRSGILSRLGLGKEAGIEAAAAAARAIRAIRATRITVTTRALTLFLCIILYVGTSLPLISYRRSRSQKASITH